MIKIFLTTFIVYIKPQFRMPRISIVKPNFAFQTEIFIFNGWLDLKMRSNILC